jgi:hypothetical protein
MKRTTQKSKQSWRLDFDGCFSSHTSRPSRHFVSVPGIYIVIRGPLPLSPLPNPPTCQRHSCDGSQLEPTMSRQIMSVIKSADKHRPRRCRPTPPLRQPRTQMAQPSRICRPDSPHETFDLRLLRGVSLDEWPDMSVRICHRTWPHDLSGLALFMHRCGLRSKWREREFRFYKGDARICKLTKSVLA